MQRLRLTDARASRLPTVSGLCQADVVGVANVVNSAQRRLLYCKEASEESWWGTWAEMAFTVSQTNPYLTLPREVARLEGINVCERPVPIFNQFYEYLQFGNGRLPKTFQTCRRPFIQQIFTRNNVPTFVDLGPAPQLIAVYLTDPTDALVKRVLVQGLDNNGNIVYSQDNLNQVQGVFVTLQSPFAMATMPGQTIPLQWSQMTGFQKDITAGNVQVFQVDPVTGAQVLLLTMEPSETTASYRRYYFDRLPFNCCFSSQTALPQATAQNITVTAIAKLELIPVMVDTDYCLLQNLEALIEEAESLRYSEIDTPAAKQFTAVHHNNAVRLLNGELTHYLGENFPSVNFAPFGAARLEYKKIGLMV